MNSDSIKTKVCVLVMAVAAMGAFALTGCSSDKSTPTVAGGATGDHTSPYPVCQAIIDACHEVDVGDPGTIHDCHETAHEAAEKKSDAECVAAKDNCVKVCTAAAQDAGVGTDGGEDHDGH